MILCAGAMFISASQQYLERFEEVKFQNLQGAGARKVTLMVGIMAAHAFGEGSGVGVSFCGHRGWAQGVLVTLAIGLHNIPEGLAVATVLVARGIRPCHALLWTLATAAPQPLVALPSFLFVDTFRSLLPVALGFAAGCMLWMVFAELLPDALADASHPKVATVATLSAAWLEGLRMMLATLEAANGDLHIPFAFRPDALLGPLCLLATCILGSAPAGAPVLWHVSLPPIARLSKGSPGQAILWPACGGAARDPWGWQPASWPRWAVRRWAAHCSMRSRSVRRPQWRGQLWVQWPSLLTGSG